jgi:Arc/MetJ-type ribon-helix-helix transcriptional regulator
MELSAWTGATPVTNDETLTLTLPPPLAREVQRAVERGDFSKPSEVVAAALNVWIERGSPPAMTDARLRALIQEADQSGEEEGDLDLDGLLAEARTAKTPR